MTIKYIFCINTGRCGSDYLTELLSKAEKTVSIHEGAPIMNGSPMQNFNAGDETQLRELMPVKLKAIQKKSEKGHKIYCETNHSFIKGWGYLIPDTYIPQEEIGVIILRRDIDKIAYSLLRIHDVPGLTEWSRTWLLSPHCQRNLSQPPENANQYDLCKWYVKETYLRAEDYQKQFPKIKYVDCNLEQLNDYNFVLEMFTSFGLTPTSELQESVGKVFNTRNEWPKLSVEELLTPPQYPSADSLRGVQRDELVTQMVQYLQDKKANEIAKIKPDSAMGGSLALGVNRIVANTEKELEEVFQYSLKFTETSGILIWELLHAINPQDILLIFCQRSTDPELHYTYNFNKTLSLAELLNPKGFLGLLKMLSMMFQGTRKQDFSHRKPQSSD